MSCERGWVFDGFWFRDFGVEDLRWRRRRLFRFEGSVCGFRSLVFTDAVLQRFVISHVFFPTVCFARTEWFHKRAETKHCRARLSRNSTFAKDNYFWQQNNLDITWKTHGATAWRLGPANLLLAPVSGCLVWLLRLLRMSTVKRNLCQVPYEAADSQRGLCFSLFFHFALLELQALFEQYRADGMPPNEAWKWQVFFQAHMGFRPGDFEL